MDEFHDDSVPGTSIRRWSAEWLFTKQRDILLSPGEVYNVSDVSLIKLTSYKLTAGR